MISPRVLKKHKCDAASLKKLFTLPKLEPQRKSKKTIKGEKPQPTPTGEPEGIVRLRRLLYSRIQEGRRNNLRDYQLFAAMDFSYDVPFSQTTPTLVQHVTNEKMTYEQSLKVVEGWGVKWTDCFRMAMNENGTRVLGKDGNPVYMVNSASLVETMIPLVKAYVTIRCAKLYTDRDQIPLFKFEPLRPNEENRILCEILNNIVEAMVTQFGYRAELRDIILHTLLYGICMTFPQEAWYCEKQEDESGKTRIVKEGLRYLQPHPTRFFYDLMYRTSSFNTDTGCTFSGHWRVMRYGDIRGNKSYFNKDVISYGTNWFANTLAGNYFSDFYPCTAQFPSCSAGSDTNREDRAAIYSLDDEDKAIFVTDMLCKLVPKDWGMGTYAHPVWFRFVMASDDTVIYAEPLAYTPNVYFGYDADGARVRNSSMALELMGFQDQLRGILSQIYLTQRQNLMNVTFYEEQIINAQQIKSLENSGEVSLRGINFVGMDSEKQAMAGLDSKQAFHTVQFAKMSTAELTQNLNTTISIAERLLGFSAQELGSAASHQQSKAEIVTISGSVGVRVAYTGTFIDDGIDAWKKQIADAAMAYMDSDFVTMVSSETPNLEKHLKKLGFSLVDAGGGRVKAKVKVSKKAVMPLILEGLASTRDGPDRGTDKEASQVQMQTWAAIANNQPLSQEVGAKTILKGMEEAAKLGGASRDFKLDAGGHGIQEAPEQADAQLQQAAKAITEGAVQQSLQQVEKLVAEQVVKPAAEAMAQQQQQIGQLVQEVDAVARGAAETMAAVQKLSEIVQMAMSAPVAPPPTVYDTPPVPPVGIQPVAGEGSVVPPNVVVPA